MKLSRVQNSGGISTLTAKSLFELYKHIPVNVFNKANNCKILKIDYTIRNPRRAIFLVRCYESYSNPEGHISNIYFEDYTPQKRDKIKPLTAQIKLKCNCPAFQMNGSAYIATKEGYNLGFIENRKPKLRDPQLKNVVCKHIARIIMALKNKTFKRLDKMKRANDIEDIYDGIISVEEVIPIISKYINSNEVLFLDKNNFEDFMVKNKLVV